MKKTEYIAPTWLEEGKKKNRKAHVLCPDGEYRDAVVKGTEDDFPLSANIELLREEELLTVRGTVRLVLNNLVFESENTVWTHGKDPVTTTA